MSFRFSGIVLASASARRKELLHQIGVHFEVAEHSVSEIARTGELPELFVKRLAIEKARSVQALLPDHPCPVLGADTIVVCARQVLGKPVDKQDALRMWALLSGRDHHVYSAVAMCYQERMAVLMSSTVVSFKSLAAQECDNYWNTGEPEGKAGAYAIQGLGALFVSAISGSYTGVVGLPLYETSVLLSSFGVRTGLSSQVEVSG